MVTFFQICVILCFLGAAALLVATFVVHVMRRYYQVDTLTPAKVKEVYSFDQGVPDQIANVMFRIGTRQPDIFNQQIPTPTEGE